MNKQADSYGSFAKILIAYIFSLSTCYFLYSIVAKTGIIYNFPINNDLGYNDVIYRYAVLIIFFITSLFAFYLHKRKATIFMHAVSIVLIFIMMISMYTNTWFEYKNVLMSSVLIFALAFYINSFVNKVMPEIPEAAYKKIEMAAVILFVLFLSVYAVYFIDLALLRHHLFLSHKFDLAWENQALYNLTFSGVPYSSMGDAVNNLGDHFSAIYYIVSVFYRFYPHPEFLLILQIVVMIFSSVTVYMLSSFVLKNRIQGIVFASLFLLHPCVQGMILFDFHPITLAIPFFFLSLYFIEKEDFKLFMIPFFTLFFIREDIALTAVFLALFLTVSKKIPLKKGIYMLITGVLLNGMILMILSMLGKDKSDIFRFYLLFPNVAGIFSLFVVNPFFEIIQAATQIKFEFILLFSAPLLFLFLLKKENIILLFPALLFTVFSKHVPQHTIGYEYSTVFLSFAFYASIIAFSKLKPAVVDVFKGKNRMIFFMLIIGIMWSFLYGSFFSKSYKLTWLGNDYTVIKTNADFYYNNWVGCFKKIPSGVDYKSNDLLDKIPSKYSVKTDVNIMPHVSGRRYLYNVFSKEETDIVIYFNKAPFLELEKSGFPGSEYVHYISTDLITIYINKKLKDFKI